MKKILIPHSEFRIKKREVDKILPSFRLIKLWREKNGAKIKRWDELKTIRRFREKAK